MDYRSNYQGSVQNGAVVCYINQASSCLPLAHRVSGCYMYTRTGTLPLPFAVPYSCRCKLNSAYYETT